MATNLSVMSSTGPDAKSARRRSGHADNGVVAALAAALPDVPGILSVADLAHGKVFAAKPCLTVVASAVAAAAAAAVASVAATAASASASPAQGSAALVSSAHGRLSHKAAPTLIHGGQKKSSASKKASASSLPQQGQTNTSTATDSFTGVSAVQQGDLTVSAPSNPASGAFIIPALLAAQYTAPSARAGKNCKHGVFRMHCDECLRHLCQHGRHRYKCKDCGGPAICEHKRIRLHCSECGGKATCVHGRQKYVPHLLRCVL